MIAIDAALNAPKLFGDPHATVKAGNRSITTSATLVREVRAIVDALRDAGLLKT